MKCYKIWNATENAYGSGKPTYIIAVVAHHAREARIVGWRTAVTELDIAQYRNMKIQLLHRVNVSHFTRPQVLKNKSGLRLGAYGRAGGKCDSCGEYSQLMLTVGKCICDFCATH